MTFIWNEAEKENYDAPAFCHPDKKKIVLTYPLPDGYDLTPNQVLSHEIGHWYFDRLFDDNIASDKKIDKRSDIEWYKYYSEMAAIYCEESITENRRTEKIPTCVEQKLLPELDEIVMKKSNDLEEIVNRLTYKWNKQKKAKKFPYD